MVRTEKVIEKNALAFEAKRQSVLIETSKRFLDYECNSKMNRVPFLYSSSKRSVPFSL